MRMFTRRRRAKEPWYSALRMHKNKKVSFMLAGFFALTINTAAHAQQKELRVAMWGDYMPLHGFVEGKAVGFEADLAKQIGHAMHRNVVFIDPKAKGMSSIEAVARGEADIALNAITPTAEREQIVGFTKPYLTLHYRVLTTPGRRLLTVQDLSQFRVTAPEGPALAALRELVGDKALSSPSLTAAINQLKKAEVDFIFGEEVGLILAGQGTDLILSGPSLGKAVIAAAVPKSEVDRYNRLLLGIGAFRAGFLTNWQPTIDPEKSDGVAVSPKHRVSDQEIKKFRQNFKQAMKSGSIDIPITDLEKRIVECAFSGPIYPGKRCSEELKRAQDGWIKAWPTVLRINAKERKSRFSHVLLQPDFLDSRNFSIGSKICAEGNKPLPTVMKPRKVLPSDGLHCRSGEGSTWTAHTRTGHVRAILAELRFEPHESFESSEPSEGSELIADFQIEQPRELLFISTMPLRSGKSEHISAEKNRILQNAIPESVRSSFRDKILRMSNWTEKEWHAYRVPGSDDQAVAMVESEAYAGPFGQRAIMIVLMRWDAGGEADLIYRTEFLPEVDELCGHPALKIGGFFDFDGDGDLDVLMDNNNPFVNGLYLLLRVDGGFRAVEFQNEAPCAW